MKMMHQNLHTTFLFASTLVVLVNGGELHKRKEIHPQCKLLLSCWSKVAKQNGFDFWLHGGTLIGQQRSGSFIPWDSDVDVARKSFFAAIANTKTTTGNMLSGVLHRELEICRLGMDIRSNG